MTNENNQKILEMIGQLRDIVKAITDQVEILSHRIAALEQAEENRENEQLERSEYEDG